MGIVFTLPLAYKIRHLFNNISACSKINPGASSWLFIIVSYLYLITWRLFGRKRLELYEENDLSSPAAMGAVPKEEEKKLDSEQNSNHLEKSQDEIFFYGVNTSEETLVLKVSRLPGKRLEIMIYLQLKDGRTFVQPHGMSVVHYTGELEGFDGGGLKLRCLSAMRIWRISFSGLLREHNSTSDEEDFKVVYVKFSFIWRALSEIYDLTSDLEPSLVSVAIQPALIPNIKRELFKNAKTCIHYVFLSKLIGVKLPEGVKESAHVFGTTPDGHIFHVAAVTIPGLCSRLHFGHLSRPNGHMNGITSCSSNLLDILGYDIICEKPTYCFSSGDKTINIQVGKSCNHFDFVNSTTQEDITFYPVTIKYNEKQASGFVFYGRRNSRRAVTNFPKDPIILPNPVHQLKERHLVVSFSDDECLNSDLTGGKGSSLGKLTLLAKLSSEKFCVPRGIVVTSRAYELFIRRPELAHAVRLLEDIAW
ncbi:uncharacterized protein LOC106473409 [Limulus polyphemus]|uniref:Uncharacterized protein LOC106473409 n=1 Tax=Limulus polyphemus TaxID=6850 RepID=A0ABM1TNW1_LIMPO|nr:uncharacterized protein LOC106473409 [Limulus polyphemus]